ncbi:MAG: ABC transporter permease [Lachnospiraceae bacterium]|nr:ABC transporter permease [Lachnospiraceae bacterium]
MKFKDILGLSLGNLKRRKWRTVLTVTGVFIGTISVVIMLSLGYGLKQSMTEQINSFGSMNDIMVYYDGSDSSMQITDDKLSEWEELPFVSSLYPELVIPVDMEQGKWALSVIIIGLPEDILSEIPIGEGRMPSVANGELELIMGNQMICDVYNKNTYEYPYWDNNQLADFDFLNDTVYSKFTKESSVKVDDNGNLVNTARKKIIPIVAMVEGGVEEYSKYSYAAYAELDILKNYIKKVYKGEAIPGQPTDRNGNPLNYWVYLMATVRVSDKDMVEDAVAYFREMGYRVDNSQEWLEETESMLNIVQLVLGGIGAVALLVAAIGITNTITMSIYERRKEIGIMKVLGCDISDIGGMFISEAAFIGFLGGVVGVILSYLLSFILNVVAGPMASIALEMSDATLSVIPFWLPFVAIAFATMIGMLAGYFPARKATRMSPLLAIRNE